MATDMKLEKCEPSIRHEQKEKAKVEKLAKDLKAHEKMPMSKAHKK